jgi:hypothetical protein
MSAATAAPFQNRVDTRTSSQITCTTMLRGDDHQARRAAKRAETTARVAGERLSV